MRPELLLKIMKQVNTFFYRQIATILCLLVSGFCSAATFTYPDNKILKTSKIYAISAEGDKVAWGIRGGVILQNKNSYKKYDKNNSPLHDATVSDVALCEGELWVTQIDQGSGYGVDRCVMGKWFNYRKPTTEGIKRNRIVKIHVDKDKFVWFGYDKYGVGKFLELVPPKFSSKDIMHFYKNSLLCLYMQKTHLWIGSINGIVRVRIETPSSHYLDIDVWKYPDFPARSCYDIKEWDFDKIVCATDRGIAQWNGKTWSLFGRRDGIKALPVKKIAVIDDKIWIGGPAGLQSWSRTNTGRLITKKDGLPSSNITALCVDKNKNLLIGTDCGAAILKYSDLRFKNMQ